MRKIQGCWQNLDQRWRVKALEDIDFNHWNRVTLHRPKGSTCLPVLPEQHIPIVPDMKIWSWVMLRVINFSYWVKPYHVTQKSPKYAVLSLRLSPYPPLNWQPTNANSRPMYLWPPLLEGLHFANGSRQLHHSLVFEGHRPNHLWSLWCVRASTSFCWLVKIVINVDWSLIMNLHFYIYI